MSDKTLDMRKSVKALAWEGAAYLLKAGTEGDLRAYKLRAGTSSEFALEIAVLEHVLKHVVPALHRKAEIIERKARKVKQ